MKLSIDKTLENNTYSVAIKFKEYGSTTMTEDEEKCIIGDFSPSFKLSDITFEGKYIYDEKTKTIKKFAAEESSTEQIVTLMISDKIVKINEDLEIRYIIKAEQILSTEVGKSLNSKELVAQAKVQLFIDKIIEKITKTMEATKSKHTTFEKVEEITI